MTEGSRSPAIVFGTGVVTVGVINDLAAEGVPVIHVSSKRRDTALRSRWPVEKIAVEAAETRPEAILEMLLDNGHRWKGACLIPTTDPMLEVVSRWHAKLSAHYRTPVMPWEQQRRVVDKALLYEAAHAAGVPAPRILRPSRFSELPEWLETVGFPVIVKPKQTPEFFRIFHAKVLKASDEAELRAHLAAVDQHGLSVMVSEIIPGSNSDLKSYRGYIDPDGRLIAELCSEKVRDHPPVFGVGIVQKTVPMIGEISDSSRTLLRALEFTGFASVEFKRDSRDGLYKLMEINPRPPMINRMFRAAGINFVYLLYAGTLGHDVSGAYGYRAGVFGIHNSLDLYYLRAHIKKGLPGMRAWLAPYLARRKAFLLPPLRDPMPLLYELGNMFAGKLTRALDGGRPRRGVRQVTGD